ncbi:MAG: tetratricopeptide repeat protein [Acidobacteria bacterium]|nr:tetratricopeptide repeat protein [Acidobacteriota bacterium]
MITRIFIVVIFLFSLSISAQRIAPTKIPPSSKDGNIQPADDLLKHLSAAETYQISGDLVNAAVENRAVIGIALQRVGNISIEEGNYPDAVKILDESLSYADSAANRTNLAIAYLRQNKIDEAMLAAQRAVSTDPKFAGAHYVLGNIYFTKEDYAAALPELEKVLQLAPDFDAAHALALTYLHLKQPERARLLFEEIQLSVGKESADLHFLFARDYESTNNPLDAERELKRTLVLEPKKLRASFYLGYLILQNGGSERLAEAGTAFENELKLTPNDFFSNFFAGVVASSENKHQKAIPYLQKAIALNPKSGEAHLFLAQSQSELNQLEAAERNLRRAVELESKDKAKSQARRTHFLLGRLLIKSGRKAEGEKELIIAGKLQQESLLTARDEIDQILGQVGGDAARPVEADPTSVKLTLTSARSAELKKLKLYLADVLARAFHNLGVIAAQNGQSGEALDRFASASNWKSDFPGLDRNWGIIGFRAGQYDKAAAPLARQLAGNPDDKLIRQMLGASYYFTNDFARAVETLKPLESTIGTTAELSYFYGISLIRLKRNQEASVVFVKLADASQSSSENLFYAAQGFMILGNYERAVQEFRTVISLDPGREKANYFIGQSLIRLNRYDEAEKAFTRELEINPSDPLSKYHLALTLIERKTESERTISILDQAIKLKFDYADAHYQLGKIYLEKGETVKGTEYLENAVSFDASKDYIHYQLSIAYRKAARKEDAERELKRYQELKAANRKNDSPM